jgi:hypothetical protein
VGLLLFTTSSGCQVFVGVRDYVHYNDLTNDFVTGYRNQVWARQSWHENKHCFADQPYLHDFSEGYRHGYREVASGGSGCPPALPPRCYWTWHYQTPEGQAKVAAWFSGYPHGAAAAERDKAGQWMQIQVSHQVRTQYSPRFQDGTIFLPDEMLQDLEPRAAVPSESPEGEPVEPVPAPDPENSPSGPAAGDASYGPSSSAVPWGPGGAGAGVSSTNVPAGAAPDQWRANASPRRWMKRLPVPDPVSEIPVLGRPDLAFGLPH